MPSSRQTLSFLRKRFEEGGIKPITRYGQNFLIDLNLLEVLIGAAELGPEDVVLEVGTGAGSLTAQLSDRTAAVVTVEVDPHMHRLAGEELFGRDNVTMLHQDALKNKNRFDPRVMQAVQEQMDKAPGRRFKLCANLPYNIATPVLSNLLSVDPWPVLMAATIQKELADRIVAGPRSKDYGALSIWMQSQCEVAVVRVMPPEVFWPRPKVHSAIVQIRPDPERRARIPDPAFFHHFVRAMFFHRRKFLRANLISALKDRLTKDDVDDAMAELELQGETRSEELDVETMLALCEAVRRRLLEKGDPADKLL
ncbi:MAG: 16S rRNA (adenine(1518)-N(6)/adenine(1519)-N(6))-dimethyltransferase RsmA [Planctomycetes bacterium]|nr:16S rRNA (adenine(1518)-N(6)/adenine(1519)-N(6))-dimethyltransferase RsmA [Planctomycetota bacterium]